MEKCAKALVSDAMADKRHNDCLRGSCFDRDFGVWIMGVADVVAGGSQISKVTDCDLRESEENVCYLNLVTDCDRSQFATGLMFILKNIQNITPYYSLQLMIFLYCIS